MRVVLLKKRRKVTYVKISGADKNRSEKLIMKDVFRTVRVFSDIDHCLVDSVYV